MVTDGVGKTLFSWTVSHEVPTPSTEVARINYWRFNNAAPRGIRTIRVLSFTWAPPDQRIAPLTSLTGVDPGDTGVGWPEAASGLP